MLKMVLRRIKMYINEIYRAVCGESGLIGLPCLIIRMQGCNLNCNYCDTDYAQEVRDEAVVDMEVAINKIESELKLLPNKIKYVIPCCTSW